MTEHLPAICEVLDRPRICGVEFNPLTRFKARMPQAGDRCDAAHCRSRATVACDPHCSEPKWYLHLCPHHAEIYRSHFNHR